MSDQAERLRALAHDPGRLTTASGGRPEARRCLVTGGKGGVGTSSLALEIAIASARSGQDVLLIDAHAGHACLDQMIGLRPRLDLGDALAGVCRLAATLVPVPLAPGARLDLLPGAHALRSARAELDELPSLLLDNLDPLAASYQMVVIDGGNGVGGAASWLACHVDLIALVTTPDPISVGHTQGMVARLRELCPKNRTAPRLLAVANQVRGRRQGQDTLARVCAASRAFLGVVVEPLGAVPWDPRFAPFQERPRGRAAQHLRLLSRDLMALERSPPLSRSRGDPPGRAALQPARPDSAHPGDCNEFASCSARSTQAGHAD